MTASASYTEFGGVVLRTPYKPAFVESLKLLIPADCRIWDADNKIWIVDGGFQSVAVDLLRRFYPGALVGEAPHRRFTVIKNDNVADPDRAELFLVPDAPIEVVRASYRALSKLRHPDCPGGSHEAMQRLNAAFERIEAQVGRKGAA